jgi:hypothetical protein
MELLLVIRTLWRRRLLVMVGLVLCSALVVVRGPVPRNASQVAWARVMLDTTPTQMVAAAPEEAGALPWRARMLTQLMTGKDAAERLAKQAGISPQEVLVTQPQLGTPELRTSLAIAATEAAAADDKPYAVTVDTISDSLSVIMVSAAAPAGASAGSLVDAMVQELSSRAVSAGTYESEIATGGTEPHKLQPFRVERVSETQERTVVDRGGYLLPSVFALLAFFAWCGVITLVPPLLRSLALALRPETTPGRHSTRRT